MEKGRKKIKNKMQKDQTLDAGYLKLDAGILRLASSIGFKRVIRTA